MTPEERITLLEEQAARMQRVIDGLTNAAEADPDMVTTLGLLLTGASNKSASSENQSVDEGATDTYSVLSTPTGFVKLGDKQVPFY